MDELVASQPEHTGRQQHEETRHAESNRCAVVGQQPGRRQRRSCRADIDAHVVPGIGAGHQMLIAAAELVAHIGDHARFDAAGAEGDQGQTQKQTGPGVIKRQRQMTRAIHQREEDDRAVLAQIRIGKNGAEEGKEIGRCGEQVKVGGRFFIGHGRQLPVSGHQVLRHEDDQNRADAVETESLRYIIDDDVGNSAGHAGGCRRRRAIGGHGHRLACFPDFRFSKICKLATTGILCGRGRTSGVV